MYSLYSIHFLKIFAQNILLFTATNYLEILLEIVPMKFFSEIIEETKKLKTPKWKETYVAAIVVSITVLVFSLVIMSMDFMISKSIISIFGF